MDAPQAVWATPGRLITAVAEWGLMSTGDPAGELPMALGEVGGSDERTSPKGNHTGQQMSLLILDLIFSFF